MSEVPLKALVRRELVLRLISARSVGPVLLKAQGLSCDSALGLRAIKKREEGGREVVLRRSPPSRNSQAP